ncbi:MAG: MogA/MoaB family molybdenum cofactor biosynthesis protein [Sporomusaceae bacterium]|nr:MogA/MoaB family molybdenum cofactor biosynthesis protein [Sporomusaceae bacterium]
MFRIGILTASDKGSRGERRDESGELIQSLIAHFGTVIAYQIVADDQMELQQALCQMADKEQADLILTTGGTGLGPRDVTPEATLAVIDRQVPGIPEAMRAKSLTITPRAMLSRATAGLRGRTLIVNLPGSPKGVKECLEVILPTLQHGLEIMRGDATECARS